MLITINFLPWRHAKARRRQQQGLIGGVLMGIAIGSGCWLFNRWVQTELATLYAQQAYWEATCQQCDATLRDNARLDKAQAQYTAQLAELAQWERACVCPIVIWNALATHMPVEMTLTRFSHTGERFLLEGVCATTQVATTFVERLQEAAWVKDLKLQALQTSQASAPVTFQLVGVDVS